VGAFPPTRCNAPEFSAVIDAGGRVNPCFFIPGPTGQPLQDELGAELNADSMLALRADIRARARSECATCVCSLWRESGSRTARDFLPHRQANA
jgi:MoaA/NifB/PqqE/SkfB family radical SAM enzyme